MAKYSYSGYLKKLKDLLLLKKRKREISPPSKSKISNLKPYEELELEIKRVEEQLDTLKPQYAKEKIKELIKLKLKLFSLKSDFLFLRRVQLIIDSEESGALEKALKFLDEELKGADLKDDELKDAYIYRALLLELLGKYQEAIHSFKKALEYDKSGATLKLYREFIKRVKNKNLYEVTQLKDEKRFKVKIECATEDNRVCTHVTKKLMDLARYYVTSPKSRHLAQQYYNEARRIYKELAMKSPREYVCEYIDILLEGVELFVMSPKLLDEVEELLKDYPFCDEEMDAFLMRLEELRELEFAKRSRKSSLL